MSLVLGLTSWFHDSSACLLQNGQVEALAEEERFNRDKHTTAYPRQAIEYCLQTVGAKLDDVDTVVFYVEPKRLLFANLKHLVSYLPKSVNLFRKGVTTAPPISRLQKVFRLKSTMCAEHGAKGNFNVVMLPHYQTHQGAAFLCSPFDDAAIITMDVAVDGTTQTIAHGRGPKIETLLEHQLPHGWGMLYSLFTQYVGFKYNDEYKVMGMAAYGEPKYVDFIEEKLYTLNDDTGEFRLNLDYFAFQHYGMRKIWDDRLLKDLGPARDRSRPLVQRDYDMAASAQLATERFGVRMAKLARRLTGSKNLTMAGGVAQNVLMNQKIVESGVFEQTFFQPMASDLGCSLGGALFWQHCIAGKPRSYEMQHLYLGPDYSEQYVRVLDAQGLIYVRGPQAAAETAKAIADGKIVGLVNGRMEAGPRALGARSILGDPRRHDMKDILNLRVKHREHFRPFAPSCLEERLEEVFEPLPGCRSLGYMITTAKVRPEMQAKVPAITHQDGTARPQAVSKRTNPFYWEIINEFYKITGVPLVVNTSFNDNEPIVCSPGDAVNCFLRTHIDLLVLGDILVYRENNQERIHDGARAADVSAAAHRGHVANHVAA